MVSIDTSGWLKAGTEMCTGVSPEERLISPEAVGRRSRSSGTAGTDSWTALVPIGVAAATSQPLLRGIPHLGSQLWGRNPPCYGICVSRSCQLSSLRMDTLRTFHLSFWERIYVSSSAPVVPVHHLPSTPAGKFPWTGGAWIGKSCLKEFLGKGGSIHFMENISVFQKEPGEG